MPAIATKSKPAKPGAKPHAIKLVPSANLQLPSTEVKLGDELTVKLEELWVDNENDRLQDRVDPASIDGLAQSISRFGLQQAIQVTRFGAPEGKWRVVFGHRRLMAVRRIGAGTIAAVPAEYRDEHQIAEARATENVQRQDLHFMEEAIAVSRLLDTFAARHPPGAATYQDASAEDKRRAVREVAERLAKPEQWVRDRAFLARLDGKTRELVLDGKLPLGHAREIAKLADPRARDELAGRAAAGGKRYEFGAASEEPMPIEDLREQVSKSLFSLAQVPWKMDVGFAGCPACVDCPSNSANNPGLFEHGTRFSQDRDQARRAHGGLGKKEPTDGVCTNHVCFGKKNAAAGQAVARAASAVSKLVRSAPAKTRDKVRREAVGQVTPEFLERDVVKAKYESRQKSGKKSKTTVLSGYQPRRQPSPREAAEAKLIDARRDRIKTLIEPGLARLFKLNPGLWSVFKIFTESKLYEATHHYDAKKSGRAVAAPEMATALKLLTKNTWESIVALEKHCGTQYGLLDSWNDGRNGIGEKIAEAFGLDIGPAPKLEDFLPKAEKLKAAEAPAPPAPPARAKKGNGMVAAMKASRPTPEAGRERAGVDDVEEDEL